MTSYDYDLFVIGGGSGGVRGARMAGGRGRQGGHRRGVPLRRDLRHPRLRAQEAFQLCRPFPRGLRGRAAGFGWTLGESSFDWSRLIANKDKEIDRLEGIYRRLLDNAGVEIIDGHARLLDDHRIEVAGRTVSAETILIATGGSPTFPPGQGWEHAITSNECFHLETLPKRVLVYGGGFIAVEFAGIFNGLGSEVTQVYRGPRVLRGFDEDIRATLSEEMAKKGITFAFNTTIENIEKDGRIVDRVPCRTGGAFSAMRCWRRPAGGPTPRTWAWRRQVSNLPKPAPSKWIPTRAPISLTSMP